MGQTHSSKDNYVRHPIHRWGRHGGGYASRDTSGKSTHFHKAIRKYGWDNFQHDILLKIECETENELMFWLDEWEMWFIEKYDSFHNGYNMTLGGHGTRGFALYGEDNPMYGKKGELAPCYGRCGEKHPLYGKTGELSPFYGHKHTEEAKRDIGAKCSARQIGGNNPKAKKVICVNNGMIFDTVKNAKEWCIPKGSAHIGGCCTHKRKKAGKHPETGEPLYWMYYDEWVILPKEEKEAILHYAKFELDKRVICIETGEIYESAKAAEDTVGGNIYKCCQKESLTANGMHWMYYGEWKEIGQRGF